MMMMEMPSDKKSIENPPTGEITKPELYDLRDFAKDKIRHRQCNTFIQNKEQQGDKYCYCGRVFTEHQKLNIDSLEEKWTVSKHTKVIPASSFGTVEFVNFGNTKMLRRQPEFGSFGNYNNPAKYVRITPDADKENLDNIWTLLSDYWNVPLPKVIISVIGGAKNFYLTKKLEENFKSILIDAATSTGAWLVTGGTYAGVNKLVGEVAYKYSQSREGRDKQLVVLGIATWGTINNNDSLVGETNGGKFPASYNVQDLKDYGSHIVPLDPNHTHFILVDDGTVKQYSKEVHFRVALETYLSKELETYITYTERMSVPLVVLLIEGGLDSLKGVLSSLEKETFLLVVRGSGRMSDYIAKAIDETNSLDLSCDTEFPQWFDDTYSEVARSMFDWSRVDRNKKDDEIRTCVNNLKKLLRKRHLIKVFTIDDSEATNEIKHAILDGLISISKLSLETQLNLALDWNSCDVAKEKIVTSTVENRRLWQGNKNLLLDAMQHSLINDKVDFVQLFLDNGMDLREFLTINRLCELYTSATLNDTGGTSTDLVLTLLQEIKLSQHCTRGKIPQVGPEPLLKIGHLIADLLHGQQKTMYQDLLNPKDDSEKIHNTLFTREPPPCSLYMNPCGPRKCTKKFLFRNPARELFIWAVLLNRKELALIFWKLGKDHIGGALIAATLLKSLSHKAQGHAETDLCNDLMDHSVTYEGHAYGTLNECYTKNKEGAQQLLVRELKLWGGGTLFNLASIAEHMDFMGHVCCQTKLNSLWKGKMALHTPIWKILLCVICPFLLFTIKFQNVDSGDKEDDMDQIEGTQKGNTNLPFVSNKVAPGEENKSTDDKKKVKNKLYKVVCCGDSSGNYINFCEAFTYFYKSPVVKFFFHSLSYLIFLGLFSYFVLVVLHPDITRTSFWLEILIWVWSGTLYVEELRQIVKSDSISVGHKISYYMSSIYNWYDQIAFLCLLIATVLRFSVADEDFGWARMLYCLTLIVHYVRFTQAFFVVQNLGPKLVMITKMFVDLSFFLLFLLVFILSYGIAAQALLYPNAAPSWSLLKNVVYQPYWQMYGELFLEKIEGKISPCTNDTSLQEDLPQCTQNNAFVTVLFVIYMIMINVLLLSLLIAMFSNTFKRVQDNAEKVWRFHRYGLIYEYFDKPTLVPPFIIFNHFFRFVKFICKMNKKNHDLKISFSKPTDTKLRGYEQDGMEAYLKGKLLEERDNINLKVKTTGDRIEKVIDHLESIETRIVPQQGNPLSVPVQPPKQQEQSISPEVSGLSKQDVIELNKQINAVESQLDKRMNSVESQLGVIVDLLKSDPQRNILENVYVDGRHNDEQGTLGNREVGHHASSPSTETSPFHTTGVFTMHAPPP